MTDGKSMEVRVSRHFDAPAERVYDAWTNPATAGEWLFATETGEMVRVEVDARVGGKFCFTDRRDGEDIDHVGEYIVMERPTKLAFTFAVPKFSAEYTTVTIDIKPAGSGCDLTLTHVGVLPDYEVRTTAGWTTILGKVGTTVERT